MAGLSLRARLGLAVVLVVVLVVGVATLLENRIVARVVETEAMDGAAATALGVAGELGERASFPTEGELDALLSSFTRAEPSLLSLTVTREHGLPAVATTDDDPAPEALALARAAVQEGRRVASAPGGTSTHYVAVPLEREHRREGAVVVGVSLEPALRVQRQTGRTAAAFALLAILVLVIAIDLLARRIVLRPLDALRSVMARTSHGDFEARVPAGEKGEIGAVGRGLNAMLDRLSDFNAALRQEVDRATAELSSTNRSLADTAQRLFAARSDLARSEQLAAAGRMAAEVAHQVGTPLNLVSGYVQMLQAEREPGSREAERLAIVRDQIARVISTVQGLLDQARRPVLDLRPTPPFQVLRGVAELTRPALGAARVALELDARGDLPLVRVDPGQLEQALLNLVSNSLDSMPEGGRLWLRARARPGFVDLVVEDTGVGIPEETLGRILDPLFTTKPPGRGTGLGLSIVRDLVTAHGGTLDFASGPGRGTTVTVRLPVVGEGAYA